MFLKSIAPQPFPPNDVLLSSADGPIINKLTVAPGTFVAEEYIDKNDSEVDVCYGKSIKAVKSYGPVDASNASPSLVVLPFRSLYQAKTVADNEYRSLYEKQWFAMGAYREGSQSTYAFSAAVISGDASFCDR